MSLERLWQEWRRRFADDDDLALDALLDVADRLARDRSPQQQESLRTAKRALLRDAFSEDENLERLGQKERARLPHCKASHARMNLSGGGRVLRITTRGEH